MASRTLLSPLKAYGPVYAKLSEGLLPGPPTPVSAQHIYCTHRRADFGAQIKDCGDEDEPSAAVAP